MLKNWLAAGLVRLGKRKAQIARDWACIDRRVVPARGRDKLYNDSFVFQGSGKEGNMFMSRLAFRGPSEPKEVWVFVDQQGRKFTNPKPLVGQDVPAQGEIAAGGLSFQWQGGDDSWRIRYLGELLDDEGRRVDADIDLVYRPRSAMYLSSQHMDCRSTGKAMAEMPWRRGYFRKLSSERQVRMEQGGILAGEMRLGKKTQTVELAAFRDHSWGRRDWSFLNRYIWNILALDEPLYQDGHAFDYLCYTTVDYGSSFRHLTAGWIAGPEKVLPIVATSDMHQLASDGQVPKRYQVAFQPAGGQFWQGEIRRPGPDQAWFMQDGGFEVNEAACTFAFSSPAGHRLTGRGMSEFGFQRSPGSGAS